MLNKPGPAVDPALSAAGAVPENGPDEARGRRKSDTRKWAYQPLLTLPKGDGNLYRGLYGRLKEMILTGSWPAGMRIPSSRTLAHDLKISRNTAVLAITQLVDDGYAEMRPRKGAFVTAQAKAMARPGRAADAAPTIAADEPRLPLALDGMPAETFQLDLWRRVQARAWRGMSAAELGDPPPAGDEGLRAAIAKLLAATRGIVCSPGQIILTSGLKPGIRLALESIGAADQPVLIEDPVPPLVVRAARGARATVDLLPVENPGPALERLSAGLAAPRAVICAPSVQMPTCTSLDRRGRQALIAWSEARGGTIIECDEDWDLRFDGSEAPMPLRSLSAERVIYVGSFNRMLFPGLRLGFVVAPDRYLARMLELRQRSEGSLNAPTQLILRDFIEDGYLAQHLRARIDLLRERRSWLLRQLQPALGSVFARRVNANGPWLVLEPREAGAAAIAARFHQNGLAATPMREFSERRDCPDRLLLGLSGLGAERRDAVASRLAAALDQAMALPQPA